MSKDFHVNIINECIEQMRRSPDSSRGPGSMLGDVAMFDPKAFMRWADGVQRDVQDMRNALRSYADSENWDSQLWLPSYESGLPAEGPNIAQAILLGKDVG